MVEEWASMNTDIASCILAKIAAGLLPLPQDAPGKVWVGPAAAGKFCDACDEPIRAGEIEYEVDLRESTSRFHQKCLAEWHQVRAEGHTDPHVRSPRAGHLP